MTTTPHSLNVPFSRPATPGPNFLQVGWYGVGAMGYYMARNLANHRAPGSSPVLVYNRSVAKSEKLLKELGADKIKIARSPDELVLASDVVFTSLANDNVVKDVYAGFAKALTESKPTKHKILCDTSTIYPSVAGELDMLISAIPNTHLVTCPVFGAPPAAIGGQLLVVLSGDYRSKKEVAHLLVPGVGRKAIDLGGNVEKAPTFKLLGNSLILGTIELLAEAMTLSEKAGIGSSQLYDFVKEMFPAPSWLLYGAKIRDDQFDGSKGFALEGGLKDANHMRRLVTELNSPMPVLDAAHGHLLTARALHASQVDRGDQAFDILDWSSLVAGARVAAGLEPLTANR
ncbi:NAD-P-binding protein [Amylocystis lapponica]|nr:NAD-P-binding protein [Amylocystis lapponica]